MGKKNESEVGRTLSVPDDLAALGVTLSSSLPTYDVPVALIEESGWNPNEMDDATFNRLVAEMAETGMVDPIQIVPAPGGKFRIIGGQHRWYGARSLGWEKIPCNILVDGKFEDVNLQKLMTVRLKVIQGKLNPEKFTRLYTQMAEVYGAEQLQALFGFTQTDAWNKLTKGVTEALSGAGVHKKLLAGLEKKVRNVKSVDGLSRLLNKLFKEHATDISNSFCVFVHEGRTVISIALNEKTKTSLDAIIDTCRQRGMDINDVLERALSGVSLGEL